MWVNYTEKCWISPRSAEYNVNICHIRVQVGFKKLLSKNIQLTPTWRIIAGVRRVVRKAVSRSRLCSVLLRVSKSSIYYLFNLVGVLNLYVIGRICPQYDICRSISDKFCVHGWIF